MSIKHIASSLHPQASDVVKKIHATQPDDQVMLAGTPHTLSSIIQPAPKAIEPPFYMGETLSPLALKLALQKITTQKQLSQLQSSMINKALQALNTYAPKNEDTRKILTSLKPSSFSFSQPNAAPSNAALKMTEDLPEALVSVLINAGVPKAEAKQALSKEANEKITFPSTPNPKFNMIHTQAQLFKAQEDMITIALTTLELYKGQSAKAKHPFTSLQDFVETPKVTSEHAPTPKSMKIAAYLPTFLEEQLVKAGVPEEAVQEVFNTIPQLSFPSTTSKRMVAQLQVKQIEAALMVLKSHKQADFIVNTVFHPKQRSLQETIQALEKMQTTLIKNFAQAKDTPATPAQLKIAKQNEKELMKLLAREIGKPEATLRAQWREELTLLQNTRAWEPVKTHFAHQGVNYYSVHTPAGKLDLGGQLLLPSYQGTGISSASTKETQHAVNLWASTFSTDKHVLFKGVRHAILSPFGLKKGSKEREEGAINRAKEVVLAALALDPDKLTQALEEGKVEVRLASTSLVTATDLPSNREGPQIADQIAAWQQLSAAPFTLTLPNAEGTQVSIEVNLKVAAFNFGVNEIALKLGPFGLGWKQSDAYNSEAFPLLIGSLNQKADIGGWAGEFLRTASKEDKQFIELLVRQIRDIWANKSHHYDANEPYKMATRVAILSHLIGVTPAWNCKSGKDRTGILDTEIKNMLIQYKDFATLSEPGASFSEADKALYRKALANTGNLEIQQYNTGVQGNKVLTTHFLSLSLLKERIGNKVHALAMRGLSFLVKS